LECLSHQDLPGARESLDLGQKCEKAREKEVLWLEAVDRQNPSSEREVDDFSDAEPQGTVRQGIEALRERLSIIARDLNGCILLALSLGRHHRNERQLQLLELLVRELIAREEDLIERDWISFDKADEKGESGVALVERKAVGDV